MIKSEINGIEPDKYPCLKRCEDIIVLFTKPLTGICLLAGKKNTDKLGEYKTDWSEFKFCKFIGNLILRNE
jgi:hypothetical protein|nr:MAG TPA: hypothetical protein [Bacteriophage sp.]